MKFQTSSMTVKSQKSCKGQYPVVRKAVTTKLVCFPEVSLLDDSGILTSEMKSFQPRIFTQIAIQIRAQNIFFSWEGTQNLFFLHFMDIFLESYMRCFSKMRAESRINLIQEAKVSTQESSDGKIQLTTEQQGTREGGFGGKDCKKFSVCERAKEKW